MGVGDARVVRWMRAFVFFEFVDPFTLRAKRRWYFASRCSCFRKLASGAMNVTSLNVAKRDTPTSIPTAGPCGTPAQPPMP
ncbi:hypothetical protein QF002_000344 [Paraburkholderia youngii]